MAKDIYETQKYTLTEFYGGIERGVCLQLTCNKDTYIQLTRNEAIELVLQLLKWVKQITEEEGEKRGKEKVWRWK